MRKQQGFSVLDVTMAAGLFGISFLGVNQYRAMESNLARQAVASDRYQEVEASVKVAIRRGLVPAIEGMLPPRATSCTGDRFLNAIYYGSDAANVTVQPFSRKPADLIPDYSADEADEHRVAFSRCSGRTAAMAGADLSNSHSVYLCLYLSPGGSESSDSIFSSQLVFAEISVPLIDFATGKSVACKDFSPPVVAARAGIVFYSIYWDFKAGDDRSFQSKRGVYYLDTSRS